MVSVDEDSLTCDFAETYSVYDWRGLPLKTAAVLAFGLSDDSRIKRKINGQRWRSVDLYAALIVDRLGVLAWQNTRDAQKGKGRPVSLYEILTKGEKEKENESFCSADAFEKRRKELINGKG